MVVYRYAHTRSGDVPKEVLGDSQGLLTVDQHSGYNRVSKAGGRTRGGCLAHARRHVFVAKEHPETAEALGLFAALYAVERHAKAQGQLGTPQHLAWRRAYSRPLFVELLRWARAQKARHEPRSLMGKACRYLLGHQHDLGRFLKHAEMDLDNNKAESALRRVALGRKNFLFVGHETGRQESRCALHPRRNLRKTPHQSDRLPHRRAGAGALASGFATRRAAAPELEAAA